MNSILITPRNAAELKLIVETLSKIGVQTCVLSEDEKEDIASALMMREGNGSDGKALVKKLYVN
jgi:hypothetical protein